MDLIIILLIILTVGADGVHIVHGVCVLDSVGTIAAVDVDEVGDDIYGDGEDDGTVVLRRDTVQCLEIS